MDANQVLVDYLTPHATPKTAAFSAKLTPTVSPARFLGVKSAPTKQAAKDLLCGNLPISAADFRAATPHPYIELDLIHVHTLNALRDPTEWQHICEAFLPHVDNWMVTDAFGPAILTSKRSVGTPEAAAVLEAAHCWLTSNIQGTYGNTYTVRAGILVLLHALLKGHFSPEHLAWIAAIHHSDYYVHMAVGWYFATAFDKYEDLTRPYLAEPGHLQLEAHRLAIRKIIESRRTSAPNLVWAKQLRSALTALAKQQARNSDTE